MRRQLSPVKCHRAPTLPLDLPVPATFYWLGANHATSSGPCSSLVTHHSSLLHGRSFLSRRSRGEGGCWTRVNHFILSPSSELLSSLLPILNSIEERGPEGALGSQRLTSVL